MMTSKNPEEFPECFTGLSIIGANCVFQNINVIFRNTQSLKNEQFYLAGYVALNAATPVIPSALKTAEPSLTFTGNEKSGIPVHHFSSWS